MKETSWTPWSLALLSVILTLPKGRQQLLCFLSVRDKPPQGNRCTPTSHTKTNKHTEKEEAGLISKSSDVGFKLCQFGLNYTFIFKCLWHRNRKHNLVLFAQREGNVSVVVKVWKNPVLKENLTAVFMCPQIPKQPLNPRLHSYKGLIT